MNTPYWLEIKESKPKESKMNEDNYDRHRITGMWWSGEGMQYDCFLMIPKQQPQSTEEEISFMQIEMFKQGQTLRALESSVSRMCQDIQAMCRREQNRDIQETTKGEQPNV